MTGRFALRADEWIHQPSTKREYNEALFTEVAPKYDFVTKALSLGRDAAWKRKLINSLPELESPMCLDLACGTGDLTFGLAERYTRGQIIGIDLCASMLSRAMERNKHANAQFRQTDMSDTLLPNNSVDIVTGGYALRNAPSLEVALDEIRRVLRPGGTAAFLDFSKSANRLVRHSQHAVLLTWGSFWGSVLHRNPEVYAYIARSLQQFPDRRQLREMIIRRGFNQFRSHRFYFGLLELIIFNAPVVD